MSTVDVPDETAARPMMERRKLKSLWYGVVSAMFFVYIGAALAIAYGTVDALIGLALTIVSYGIINKVIAGYALRHGVGVAEFSRSLLGSRGAVIATIILFATALYYPVFESSIVAVAFQAQFGGPLGLWYAVVVLYSVPLVIGRVRQFLDRLNSVLMPIYWGGLVLAVVWAAVKFGYSNEWITHSVPTLSIGSGGPGWLAAFASYVGVWVLMMYTMDFAAMGRPEDEAFHERYTFGYLFYVLAFGANALIGIFLTFTIPGTAATETGVASGLVGMMGLLGLLVVFVSQTRINTANYHLAISNLADAGKRILRVSAPMWVWAVVTGVAMYLMMLLPVVEYLLVALKWQGVFITGWVAIAVTHIVMDARSDRGADPTGLSDSAFRHYSLPGVASWVIATAAGLIIVQSSAAWASGIGVVVTPLLASVLYALLRTGMRRPSARVEQEVDTREVV